MKQRNVNYLFSSKPEQGGLLHEPHTCMFKNRVLVSILEVDIFSRDRIQSKQISSSLS